MKVKMNGPIIIETVEDAQKLFWAVLAASGYREEVASIPGPTIGALLSGDGDVHAPTAEKHLAKHGADVKLFAWLVMRGFPDGN